VGIEIPKSYEPKGKEEERYEWWVERGYFRADADAEGEPFCMVMPPPNVTGSLHMGHALNMTLQDILARWKRMQGFNVLWVPGTDHAGIATQNVVERQLAEKGLHRTELGREKFEALVWEWKEEAQKNILRQVRRLGGSCDWSRERFTLDEGLSRAVREVFVQLYRDGLIYRGEYLVNWCLRCGTAISDLEVEYRETAGHLWHICYPLSDGSGSVTVATTRPETMLGDTGVAVHPEDDRYRRLRGKSIRLPLMDRDIPVIFDAFVDPEFGTGVVKVTPGHDPADFEAGQRNRLEIIQVIGNDGRMTTEAGKYAGLDRYEARRQVVEDLEKLGLLEKVEKYSHNVGRCQRCSTTVEPLVSRQWFVRVGPLAEKAIRAVEEKRTVFNPPKYEKIYFEWMRNIHDWCISRQLWWGHRIPAWYCRECDEITVSTTMPESCSGCGGTSLEQESDVLDTWFSSALWPFSTLGWPDKTRDLEVYYPTSTMVTGFDIIFFWVARMMMMGLRFMNDVPFREVFINGLVRDEHGQKMSKSRGNVIDPLEIIDQYGTDAVRFTLSILSVPGGDIPFSVNRMAGYRAFCNKIWNAARFLLLKIEPDRPVQEKEIQELIAEGRLCLEDRWILSRLQQVTEGTNKDLGCYSVHEASNRLYHFFWHEFCDWYIELIKIRVGSGDSRSGERARKVALYVLETSLRLLHPFMPFITEELWQKVPHSGETIMLRPYPESRPDWISEPDLSRMEQLREFITAVRTTRTENKIDPRARIRLLLHSEAESRTFLEEQQHHLASLIGTGEITFVAQLPEEGLQLQGGTALAEFVIPLDDLVDLETERRRVGKELEKAQRELLGLERKLQNERFLQKAPGEVVANTRKRHREVRELLKAVQNRLERLG